VEILHDFLLLTLLVAIALGIMRLTSLLAIAILGGVYSLVLAVVYVLLDAVDVAFTEAAVGAGITLTFMLAAISLTTRDEKPRPIAKWPSPIPLVVTLVVGAALVYALSGMPNFGSEAAPINHHVVPRYIQDSPREIGVPNIVTSVLASYRGYDTLGEVTVIFTAGVGVMVLLGRSKRRRQEKARK
jgi:multicomponent Na+:H+ antiporter subunit B